MIVSSYDMMANEESMPSTDAAHRPVRRETLADQIASDITNQILDGELVSGSALPAEPQLAEQYGVSRSVIRDATRLLLARGLVEVRQGKGVFVTASQSEPFADALLLALRRDGATAWDVDEFVDRLDILAVSLATENATDEEIDEIERRSGAFLEALEASNDAADEAAFERVAQHAEETYDSLHEALIAATHNKVLEHVARPLRALRRLREWDLSQVADEIDAIDIHEFDRRAQAAILECLRSRDPSRAEPALSGIVQLPQEAIDALKRTPVGEVAHIVMTVVPTDLKEESSG
jgi:DNA-binding FadR family transcriptional regulator